MSVRVGLLVLCVAAACGGSGNGGTGGGSAGTGGGSAAGGGTAGGTAGGTGGSTGGSGGGTTDAGTGGNGGSNDAGTIIACTTAITGCTTFEDHTDAGDARSISFGPGFMATPPCITVKVGQTVTFVSTATHPMAQDCGPVNGVLAAPEAATTHITMNTPGEFGYFCTVHGFTGAIQVNQ